MHNQIEGYLEQLRAKNASPNTIDSYQMNLGLFERYCALQNKHDLKEITLEDLRAYHRSLLTCSGVRPGSKLTPNTLHLKLRMVKRFFDYLEHQGQVLVNPAERLDLPKLQDRLPKDLLSEKELLSLLNQPDVNRKVGLRDRALMELLYSTGLRRSECANLQLLDVDTQGGVLRVNQGKGRKARIVPLGKKACDWVRQYLLKSRPRLNKNPDCQALWIGICNSKPLGPHGINAVVKYHARRAGIKVPVTVHTFRRSAVTHMLRRDAHPLYLQRFLGHSTGESLRKYLIVSAKDLKDAHRKTHPGEKARR